MINYVAWQQRIVPSTCERPMSIRRSNQQSYPFCGLFNRETSEKTKICDLRRQFILIHQVALVQRELKIVAELM